VLDVKWEFFASASFWKERLAKVKICLVSPMVVYKETLAGGTVDGPLRLYSSRVGDHLTSGQISHCSPQLSIANEFFFL
jgi:hypothetical protein